MNIVHSSIPRIVAFTAFSYHATADRPAHKFLKLDIYDMRGFRIGAATMPLLVKRELALAGLNPVEVRENYTSAQFKGYWVVEDLTLIERPSHPGHFCVGKDFTIAGIWNPEKNTTSVPEPVFKNTVPVEFETVVIVGEQNQTCPKDGRACPVTIRNRDCAKRKGNPAYVKANAKTGKAKRWQLKKTRVKRVGNPDYVLRGGRWFKRRPVGRPRSNRT